MNFKRKLITVLFLVMVSLGALAFVYSQDWPMVGHDVGNTGYVSSSGPSVGNLRWEYTIGDIVSPPVVADGKVYVSSYDGKIYCLDADSGASLWNYSSTGYEWSSPAVADNKVYLSLNEKGKVYCLNADWGFLIWEHEFPLETSLTSPTVADGLVFVGSASGWVYSLDADTGDQVSSYPIDVFGREYPIHSSPVVADGKVYIVHDNFYGEGYVTCLNTFLGLEWLNSVGANILKSPSVADGKVFVSLEGNKVNCLDADTGFPIWEFENRDDVTSSPTVADGEVYIGLEYGTIYCIDAYVGTWIWQYSTGHDVTHTAVAGGNVYIFSDKLYCLNADTGELIWDYFIGDYLTAPAVADGKVYVASNGGTVYCFGSTLEERITSLEAENAATWINFGLLPGTRINIYSEDSYSITEIETTHVWHGFRSSFVDPWSTLSEEQQTEFLTTAKWHFFVNDEEVSLDHVLRYDEKNDAMWSLYYRVFPPGYFDLNRNNKLVGEWVGMENGEWYSTIRTAELRVK